MVGNQPHDSVGNKSCLKADLRERSIPLREEGAASAHDYHEVPIDLGNSLSAEPLVHADVYRIAHHSYYARKDRLNAPYFKSFSAASKNVYLRKSVLDKLVSVNKTLSRYNVELCLLDGYRPIDLQKEVWDDFCNQARSVLDNPTEEECAWYAGLYCSDPRSFDKNNFRTWPVHTTGGAIDLTLRLMETKEHLFFGSIFDDATEISFTDHFERNPQKTDGASVLEARRNRRLLYWAMIEQGFTNYPYEWWHFDYGTQMWAIYSKTDAPAFYGYIEPLE